MRPLGPSDAYYDTTLEVFEACSHATTTAASEVLAVVRQLTDNHVTYQVNGGWAVDALLGRQTRDHRDLDVFVDASAVPDLLGWLKARGYEAVEDWLPVRIELASTTGRIDVHPMVLEPNGDGIQQGLGDEVFRHAATDRTLGHIEGHPVVVANAERLLELRRGYEARPQDEHDIQLLQEWSSATRERPGPATS